MSADEPIVEVVGRRHPRREATALVRTASDDLWLVTLGRDRQGNAVIRSAIEPRPT